MSSPKGNLILIANAIIWAGVIIAMTFLLQGTSFMPGMVLVLGAGAAASILLTATLAKGARS